MRQPPLRSSTLGAADIGNPRLWKCERPSEAAPGPSGQSCEAKPWLLLGLETGETVRRRLDHPHEFISPKDGALKMQEAPARAGASALLGCLGSRFCDTQATPSICPRERWGQARP